MRKSKHFTNFMLPKRFSELIFIRNTHSRIFESQWFISTETGEKLFDQKNIKLIAKSIRQITDFYGLYNKKLYNTCIKLTVRKLRDTYSDNEYGHVANLYSLNIIYKYVNFFTFYDF